MNRLSLILSLKWRSCVNCWGQWRHGTQQQSLGNIRTLFEGLANLFNMNFYKWFLKQFSRL